MTTNMELTIEEVCVLPSCINARRHFVKLAREEVLKLPILADQVLRYDQELMLLDEFHSKLIEKLEELGYE